MEQMPNRRCHPSLEQWIGAFAISAVAATITTPIAVSVNVWSGASTTVLCFVPMRWIAPRMPEKLSGARQRRPMLSVAWLVLVLIAVVQMTRLSAFMVDSSRLRARRFRIRPLQIISASQLKCMRWRHCAF